MVTQMPLMNARLVNVFVVMVRELLYSSLRSLSRNVLTKSSLP